MFDDCVWLSHTEVNEMKRNIKKAMLALVLVVSGGTLQAEDIDLFLGNPAPNASGLPNVLLLIDNTANWNTAFNNEKAALVATFAGLPVDKFNVGVMMFSDPAVGHIRAAIRPMTAANRSLYSLAIDSMTVGGDRANARTLSRNMSEAYRYLNGLESTDTSKVKSSNNSNRDYTGNTSASAQFQAIHALADSALSNSNATTYNGPLDPNGCADTFIIYIGNNVPSGNVTRDNTSRNNAAGSELDDAGGDTTQIPLTYTSHQDNYADEWARFMNASMGVKVYTVDVDPTPRPGGHSNGMGNSDLLESMATVSGGKYFRVDSSVGGGAEIKDALEEIFSEIQSVNTVFASVALPASATTQSTFLNQVFIGMFRPDGSQNPRWFGNLKQYRLGLVGSAGSEELKLLDARQSTDASGDPVYYEAINSNTGFITECARSYWTPTTADSYWASPLVPQGDCVGEDPASNTPDGPVVEKGGQAYTRRASATRTVYSCVSAAGVDCSTAGGLGVYGYGSADNGNALVNWAVGQDVDNEDGRATAIRASVHGDVIHARPVALNYGDDANPEIAVFYGSNDGLLRAVNGNRSDAVSSVVAGGEFWAFKPLEFGATEFTRLRDNTAKVQFPATGQSAGLVGTPKDYGMDGAIVAFDGVLNGADTKYVYATLRRGGRAVYAFDVSTVTSPELLWREGCEKSLSTSASCTDSDWTNIGQTWSAPSVAFLEGYDDGDATDPQLVPLLLMGGGYDTCEDYDAGAGGVNHMCVAASKGNSIYVVNGETGEVLKEFATLRAVPGAITVVPVSKIDPEIKFAYAADTGGNVYRISGPVTDGVADPIGSTLPSSWEITQIASLGCASVASCTAPRKFLFGPDVVEPDDANGKLYILLGSGDREKPLLAYGAAMSVQNYAFALVDDPADGAWLTDETSSCGADIICLGALTSVTVADGVATGVARDRRGWKLALATNEQVISSTLTASDTLYFSTHIPTLPDPNSCDSNLGVATTYGLDYEYGKGEAVDIIGGGLVPSPVAGRVVLDDGTVVPFCIGCGGEQSSIGGMEITSSAEWEQPTGRVYWRIEK
jgi:type IV pilus assembly protein PilY1